MKTTHHSFIGIATAIVAANLFSSKVILVKLAFFEGSTPLQILALRMAVAFPFFAILAILLLARRREDRPGLKDYAGMTLMGMIGYYLSSLLDFHGMVYLTAGMERLLLYLYPTFLVIIRSVMERSLPRPLEVASLALAYAGTALVYHDERLISAGDILPGVLMVVGSAFCFANYLYFSSRYIKRFGSRLYASYSTAVSSLAILLHGLASGQVADISWTPAILLLGITLGIFCTVLPTYAMHAAIGMIGSAKVGLLGTTGIVGPLILGVAFLGEPLTPYRISGMALVLLAVLALNLQKRGD